MILFVNPRAVHVHTINGSSRKSRKANCQTISAYSVNGLAKIQIYGYIPYPELMSELTVVQASTVVEMLLGA